MTDLVSLTRTLGPLLKWLRAKKPRAIAAKDMFSGSECLAGTFLRENGVDEPDVRWYGADLAYTVDGQRYLTGDKFAAVVRELCQSPEHSLRVTAARALTVAERISKKRRV